MTAREIYERYQIPPWLQLHQLRVAAVGRMVAEARGGLDTDLVVKTCLLHDIGAIVKFDFSEDPHNPIQKLYPPGERPHWIAVQKDMRARYGEKEYAATGAIIAELGLDHVNRVFTQLGFTRMREALAAHAKEVLIVQYADMRVGPYGILPLSQRIPDVLARYRAALARDGRSEEAQSYLPVALEIEDRIFAEISLQPEDITDASAAPVIEQLWDYDVS